MSNQNDRFTLGEDNGESAGDPVVLECDLCESYFLQEEGGQVTEDTILCPRCIDRLVILSEILKLKHDGKDKGSK